MASPAQWHTAPARARQRIARAPPSAGAACSRARLRASWAVPGLNRGQCGFQRQALKDAWQRIQDEQLLAKISYVKHSK